MADEQGLEPDLRDIEAGIRLLSQQAGRRSSQVLRRASFRIAAYFGKHFDESGPPKGVVSTSPRLAIRTGGIFRSTVPGQTGNVNEFSFESANAVWNYGSKVFYWMFHEYADSFNVHFKQRETFNPAIADFAAKEGPVIGDEVGLVLQKIWEGR